VLVSSFRNQDIVQRLAVCLERGAVSEQLRFSQLVALLNAQFPAEARVLPRLTRIRNFTDAHAYIAGDPEQAPGFGVGHGVILVSARRLLS
jgi:hypothetical protein